MVVAAGYQWRKQCGRSRKDIYNDFERRRHLGTECRGTGQCGHGIDCTGNYKKYDEAYNAAVESLESGKANECLNKLMTLQ